MVRLRGRERRPTPFLSRPEGEGEADASSPGEPDVFVVEYRDAAGLRDRDKCIKCGSPLLEGETRVERVRCGPCLRGERMTYESHRERCALVFAEPMDEGHFESWQNTLHPERVVLVRGGRQTGRSKLFQLYKEKSRELTEEIQRAYYSGLWREAMDPGSSSSLLDPLRYVKPLSTEPELLPPWLGRVSPVCLWRADGTRAGWARSSDGPNLVKPPRVPICDDCRDVLGFVDEPSGVCCNCRCDRKRGGPHGDISNTYYGATYHMHRIRSERNLVDPMREADFEEFKEARMAWVRAFYEEGGDGR